MNQKDIFLADLARVKGSEQSGIRPVVVISGDTMNSNFDVAIVCPISSKIKDYASCVKLKKSPENGLNSDSEILTFRIRTIAKARFLKKIGEITEKELQKVFMGLADVLKY